MYSLLLAVIYISFISLGLPDSLLGAAWPAIQPTFGVPVSWSGIIFFITAAGTVVSSLLSDRLTSRFGAGKVTAFSVLMTCCALFLFSSSSSFWMMAVAAVPYGLGAGGVDAALNNYVALHYKSRHMSWLHCMWGVGASAGPMVMGACLSRGLGWGMGYRVIGIVQAVLTVVLFLTLCLWSTGEAKEGKEEKRRLTPLKEVVAIPGMKAAMLTFFCYCALEQGVGLWASTWMVESKGMAVDTAASCAGLFFIGITTGRFASGFLTFRFDDRRMVVLGQWIVLLGVLLMMVPGSNVFPLAGVAVVGLGCAPIYPSVIHSLPILFGRGKSQAATGLMMAFAYVGNCVMPPLFGQVARSFGSWLLPFYLLLVILAQMAARKAAFARAPGAREAGW